MVDLTNIYRVKTPSTPTKAVFIIFHFVIAASALWLLFGGGIEITGNLFGIPPNSGNETRRLILAVAAVLYFIRTIFTVVVFIRRRIAWSEVSLILTMILVCDLSFAFFGGLNSNDPDLKLVVGLVFLLLGSGLNTGSELQRHIWKKRPVNKGRIFDAGLFNYSRHINYFGDAVLFTGWALITGYWFFLLVPIAMSVGFITGNIPAQDKYLEERYGDEYRSYAERVAKFVPFVY